MADLHPDEPLDEGYWESLGMEGGQARKSDPFSGPPPGHNENPFSGQVSGPSGRSRYEATWLKTKKGIEFIDVFVGETPDSDDTHMLIFLYEVIPGRFNVGFSRPKTTVGGEFRHRDKTYDEAKRLAENEAAAMSVDAGANADWRHDPAGQRQIDLAMRMGYTVDLATATKGSVSDQLNVHFSSRTLDPTFATTRS